MSFAHLTVDLIKKIRGFFLLAEVSYDDYRDLLMARIAAETVQKLDRVPNSFNQLAGDLRVFNSIPSLSNDSVPMKIWLENATSEFSERPEAEIFTQALAEMKKGPAEKSDTGVIVEGIEALWELIKKDSNAYDAVVFYREVFQKALWEIDVISDYKVMHDALHTVQLNWPELSVVKVLLQLKPPQLSTLTTYSASLNRGVAFLNDIYQEGSVDGSEKNWIDKLDVNQKKLDVAIETERNRIEESAAVVYNDGDSDIEDTFEIVKNQLNEQLSFLNTRLKAGISQLHLKDMIDAMNKVCMEIRRLSPDHAANQVEQYASGVTELTILENELTKLMTEHDKWQQADSLLEVLNQTFRKRVESPDPKSTSAEEEELGADDNNRLKMEASRDEEERQARLSNLKFIVTAIEQTVEPLREAKATFWSVKLLGAYHRLKTELDKRNAVRAEEEFDNYRDHARRCFFELDKELKKQCDGLRTIAESLRKVNDEMRVNYALELM